MDYLFGYQKYVIKFGFVIQFMHLIASSYKGGTKILESTLTGLILSKQTLSGENNKILHERHTGKDICQRQFIYVPV